MSHTLQNNGNIIPLSGLNNILFITILSIIDEEKQQGLRIYIFAFLMHIKQSFTPESKLL